MRFRMMFIITVLLAWSVPALAQGDLPMWDDLEAGTWTMIEPGGDTICALGTPYAYFVRPAEQPSDQLLIYFQGGGACWLGQICDPDDTPTYDRSVDAGDSPDHYDGIFNFENDENPFLNYNVVFIPYCTGDVFLGDRVATYRSRINDEVTIHHNGYVNAMTVLDWTFANAPEPATVFVTGSSAGAIPSPFYAQFVAEAYPDARIEQFGDAAGGYRNQVLASAVFSAWGTESILTEDFAGIRLGELNFERLYRVIGAKYPGITFSQYNAAYDETQMAFVSLGTLAQMDMQSMIDQNMADIAADVENFVAYTAGGALHTILPREEFYTYAVDGVRIVDWVRQIAQGEDVLSQHCEDCSEPEEIGE
ncbi:MAG: hypothetical protein KC615_10975 [Anaerolineae bacterium]|nr:hypothetical protein [Anaerolineae bacterium]